MLPSAVLVASLFAVGCHGFITRSWDDAYALANSTVAQMTMDEKLGIIIGTGQLNSARRCVGDTTAVSRLGVPSICMQDGPAGVRLVRNVTAFPSGINTGATFSRRLMRARGVALAEEFRGKGAHVYLGPAMDVMRNPKAGRAWESFGPDPYLNGEGAYETIMGVQSMGVQACAKHFLANNQEHWRYGLSSNLDDRTMHEIYFYPFLRSIEADVVAVMCAYNRFNDTSSCHNANLIGPNGILRKNGFQGYVVSDWGATHDSASDNANAGLDMEMPGDYIIIGGGVYGGIGQGLKTAVDDGQVSMGRFNQMVERILASWYHLGQDSGYPPVNFDAQQPDGTGSNNLNVNVRTDAHTALVREIAAASAVLLKNNRTVNSQGNTIRGLPAVKGVAKTIAVVGQDAIMPNLSCDGLNECDDGTMDIGWGSGSNSLQHVVPPIDAINAFLGSSTNITTSLTNDVTQGAKAAARKDMAFVYVNAMSGELGTYDIVDGNMGDRNDLNLWFSGSDLVEGVAAVCTNTVVIVHSVGPVYLTFSDHPNITAIIYAGAPGEQTGPGIVDVIYGAVNPSGRLPFSIANSEDAYGTSIVYLSPGFPDINYTEKLLLDYRYMDANNITPRYEFGFGLSYTTFTYSSISISSTSSGYTVTFTVANSGSVAGTEHPQLYLGYPGGAGEPERVLRGFEEVMLGVGENQSVAMNLTIRDLSIWDTPSQTYIRPPGTFTVWVGASIKDVRLTGSIYLISCRQTTDTHTHVHS